MSSSPAAANSSESEASSGVATASTYGALDTSTAVKEMWMVRVPPKLAAAWEDVPEGTVLGELVLTKKAATNGGKGKKIIPSLTVAVSEEISQETELPTDYSVEAMTKKVPTLHPFTRKENGSVDIHGIMTRSCNLQMERTDRFRHLCQKRLMDNLTKKNFVKPVESSELSVRNGASSSAIKKRGFGAAVQKSGEQALQQKQQQQQQLHQVMAVSAGEKRKFGESTSANSTTQSVLFELFASQPYWSVKDLRAASGRLEKDIRAVLSDIGTFHRAGEHKGMWELKHEFQNQAK